MKLKSALLTGMAVAVAISSFAVSSHAMMCTDIFKTLKFVVLEKSEPVEVQESIPNEYRTPESITAEERIAHHFSGATKPKLNFTKEEIESILGKVAEANPNKGLSRYEMPMDRNEIMPTNPPMIIPDYKGRMAARDWGMKPIKDVDWTGHWMREENISKDNTYNYPGHPTYRETLDSSNTEKQIGLFKIPNSDVTVTVTEDRRPTMVEKGFSNGHIDASSIKVYVHSGDQLVETYRTKAIGVPPATKSRQVSVGKTADGRLVLETRNILNTKKEQFVLGTL